MTVETTVGAAPPRSLDQRMEALRWANTVRTRRADLKRDIKAGTQAPLPLIAKEPPDWLETMKVYDLLMAMPKIGRVKATRVLNRCRISPSKTIAGISRRQRLELVRELRR